MARMITETKEKPKKKSVLLFSGGMDSVMMEYLLQPDVLLVLPHGQQYQERELQSIARLAEYGHINQSKLIIDSSLSLGKWERDDAIIPSRNLLFVTIAANYGDTIFFGSVGGDRSLDKSIEFFEKSKNMLDYLYQPQHWCEGRTFTIEAPFKHVTKAELTGRYLRAGGSIHALRASYSCYSGKEKPCGHCKPCFRKWVALHTEKELLVDSDYWEKDPLSASWVKEVLEQVFSTNGWRGAEDMDVKKALLVYGIDSIDSAMRHIKQWRDT